MQQFSLLDLSPIAQGGSVAQALADTVLLAKMAERVGYQRFWLAEHHNMPGIASAATAVLIGHVAGATTRIRVGAGGIMLPNHAPLLVAEAFGTLATLYPNRIDLGVGRAPGTDPSTLRALRRTLGVENDFKAEVEELLNYFQDISATRVRAVPGQGTQVPVWILGSSLNGAQLAAQLGLPYAFASHFAPAMLEQALALYRQKFQPSAYLDKPYAMVAVGVCAADDDQQAAYLLSSQILAFAQLQTGMLSKLPRPVVDVHKHVSPQALVAVKKAMACSAVGSKRTIETQLLAINEKYQPDELIVTGLIHDTDARIASFEIAANVLADLCC